MGGKGCKQPICETQVCIQIPQTVLDISICVYKYSYEGVGCVGGWCIAVLEGGVSFGFEWSCKAESAKVRRGGERQGGRDTRDEVEVTYVILL